MMTREVTIRNELGLHSKSAAYLIITARAFKSEISFEVPYQRYALSRLWEKKYPKQIESYLDEFSRKRFRDRTEFEDELLAILHEYCDVSEIDTAFEELRKDCEFPRKVDANSILDILALSVENGDRLRVNADGIDAEDALESIVKLIERGFGEE